MSNTSKRVDSAIKDEQEMLDYINIVVNGWPLPTAPHHIWLEYAEAISIVGGRILKKHAYVRPADRAI